MDAHSLTEWCADSGTDEFKGGARGAVFHDRMVSEWLSKMSAIGGVAGDCREFSGRRMLVGHEA